MKSFQGIRPCTSAQYVHAGPQAFLPSQPPLKLLSEGPFGHHFGLSPHVRPPVSITGIGIKTTQDPGQDSIKLITLQIQLVMDMSSVLGQRGLQQIWQGFKAGTGDVSDGNKGFAE
jgi:hypothetical protein